MTTENTLTNEEKLAWERNPAKRLTLTDAPIPFEPKLIRVSWPRSVTVLDVEGNDVTQRLEDDGILFSINVKPVEEATANALFEQTEITFTSFPNEVYGNGVYNIEKSNDGENWELVAVVEPTEKIVSTLVPGTAPYWRVSPKVHGTLDESAAAITVSGVESPHIYAIYDDTLEPENDSTIEAIWEILPMSEYFTRGETPKFRVRLTESATGKLLTAADFKKISYTIYKLGAKYSGERIRNAVPGHVNVEIPTTCVKDACVVGDPHWTKDDVGYNFFFVPDGTVDDAIPDAGDYVAEILFVPNVGNSLVVSQTFTAK